MATIAPRGYLILAVDADDTDTEPFTVNPNDPIKANSISVRGIWPNLTADNVVELEIEEGTTIEPRTDLIIDMPDTRQPMRERDRRGAASRASPAPVR